MADETGAERLDVPEEEEGGPVKSFLEHLEDLRWVLIKSIAAGGVAMLACFFAGNYLVKVLEWPLKRAPIDKPGKEQRVRVMLGTNQLAVFRLGTNDQLAELLGTNQYARLEITPVLIGTNQLLGVIVKPETQVPRQQELPIDIINLSPT